MRDPGPLAYVDPLTSIVGGFDGILRDAKKEPGRDGPKGPEETPKARPKATEADSARATKKPTPAQVKEINDLIARAQKHFYWADVKEVEAGSKAAQRAIDLAVKYYGIDNNHASRVIFAPSSGAYAAQVDKDRVVYIHNPALTDAPSLAATLVHEVTHANQMSFHGYNGGTNRNVVSQNNSAREAMAYQAALSNADVMGLSEDRKKWYADKVDMYTNDLSKENRKLFDGGQYWDMKAGESGQ